MIESAKELVLRTSAPIAVRDDLVTYLQSVVDSNSERIAVRVKPSGTVPPLEPDPSQCPAIYVGIQTPLQTESLPNGFFAKDVYFNIVLYIYLYMAPEETGLDVQAWQMNLHETIKRALNYPDSQHTGWTPSLSWSIFQRGGAPPVITEDANFIWRNADGTVQQLKPHFYSTVLTFPIRACIEYP